VDVLQSDTSVQVSSNGGAQTSFRTSSGGGSSGVEFATFAEPTQEALSKGRGTQGFARIRDSGSSSSSSEAANVLRNYRYIRGSGSSTTFYTKCFYNTCSIRDYIFYIKATCDFSVYLIDQYGNIVQNIGTGYANVEYAFPFQAKCGKYKIKIVLNCDC